MTYQCRVSYLPLAGPSALRMIWFDCPPCGRAEGSKSYGELTQRKTSHRGQSKKIEQIYFCGLCRRPFHSARLFAIPGFFSTLCSVGAASLMKLHANSGLAGYPCPRSLPREALRIRYRYIGTLYVGTFQHCLHQY